MCLEDASYPEEGDDSRDDVRDQHAHEHAFELEEPCTEVCKRDDPPMVEVEPGHFVKCHTLSE